MEGRWQFSGAADAGTELDDAPAVRGGDGQQSAGQAEDSGAQDALAETGEQPLALHAGGLRAGAGAMVVG